MRAFLKRKAAHAAWAASYLACAGWANLGPVSRALSRLVRSDEPPIVLLSLPRSGSSWIGNVLSSCEEVAYLHEPVTQRYLERTPGATVVPMGDTKPAGYYEALVRDSLVGLPPFRRGITPFPSQWILPRWPRRRLVVKEVNPLACEALLAHPPVRLLLLVRHPAAVALSYRKLGWLGHWDNVEGEESDGSVFYRHGWFQGKALAHVQRQIAGNPDHDMVSYEGFCIDPVGELERICGRFGLEAGAAAEQYIARTTATDRNLGNHYGHHRRSKRMPDRWRGQLTDRELGELRAGFDRGASGFYAEDDDW